MCFGKTFHLILIHFIPNIQCFEEFFFSKTDLFISLYIFKNSVFLEFRLIQSIFQLIEIVFKIFMESLSISINRNCCFDQSNFENKVFKNSDLTCSNHFFKSFSKLSLSLRLGKVPQQIFCCFPPNFLQGFSLHCHKTICHFFFPSLLAP